jgi:hypothetical protein
MGGRDLLTLPASLMLNVVYSLVVEDTKEAQDTRDRLDNHLNSLVIRTGARGKPDRATWGRLPHQQAAMKAAQTAAG